MSGAWRCMAVRQGGQGISGLGMVGSMTAGIAADGNRMRNKARKCRVARSRVLAVIQAGWARFVMACGRGPLASDRRRNAGWHPQASDRAEIRLGYTGST